MVSYLCCKGACGVATTPAVGEWMRRGEKGHPKSRKKLEKKTPRKHEIQETSRLFEAHLGIFSGLVDQGLVARCFRVLQSHFKVGSSGALLPDASGCFKVLQYQAFINNHLLERKGTTKSKPWKICHLVTRQQMQVTIPDWVAVREGVRDAFFVLRLPVILGW